MDDIVMKRYLIFGGRPLRYASGGFNDVIGHADTLDDAEHIVSVFDKTGEPFDRLGWYQIVDMTTREIVVLEDAPLGADEEGSSTTHVYKNGTLMRKDHDA